MRAIELSRDAEQWADYLVNHTVLLLTDKMIDSGLIYDRLIMAASSEEQISWMNDDDFVMKVLGNVLILRASKGIRTKVAVMDEPEVAPTGAGYSISALSVHATTDTDNYRVKIIAHVIADDDAEITLSMHVEGTSTIDLSAATEKIKQRFPMLF